MDPVLSTIVQGLLETPDLFDLYEKVYLYEKDIAEHETITFGMREKWTVEYSYSFLLKRYCYHVENYMTSSGWDKFPNPGREVSDLKEELDSLISEALKLPPSPHPFFV